MGTAQRPRHCARCGTRLARDNTRTMCGGCQTTARDALLRPPTVPRGFWDVDQMRDALGTWHIGRVIYAYRTHPWHGRTLLQDLVAHWLGITQAQLSRLENGRALEKLSSLIHYARVLAIPGELLWFQLPGGAAPWGPQEVACHDDQEQPDQAVEPSAPRLLVPVRQDAHAQGGKEGDPTKRRDAIGAGLAAVTPGLLSDVLHGSREEAFEFTRLAETSGVGAGTLDHLDAATADLARAYATRPPVEVFAVARAYRRRVQGLLHGHVTLKERRDLYVHAAVLDQLLAWAAQDLGDHGTAHAYAIDGFEHADQAGHGELCAHATVTIVDLAAGDTRRTDRPDPTRAIAAARRGIAKAPSSSPLAVRVRGSAARAFARFGDREASRALLAEARHLHERLPAAPVALDPGTLNDFVLCAYPHVTYLHLGDFPAARDSARDAVTATMTAHAQASTPSTGAIPRIDLAIALAELGAPDEAITEGRRALSSPAVAQATYSRASRLDAVLARRYPDLPDAREFREEYRALAVR